MKILKIILFISVFVFSYLLVCKVYAINIAKKLKANYTIKKYDLLKPIKERVTQKFNIQINIYLYIMAKLILAGALFLSSCRSYNSLIWGIAFAIVGYFIPDIFVRIFMNSQKKIVLTDLLNITQSLKIQLSSHIPLLIALKNIPELCENKRFKKSMTDLYLEYELTGFSLISALNDLKNKFPYSEINIFACAMEQQYKSGEAVEAYNNLISILKDKYIEYIESNTQSKTTIMILAVVVILINLTIMGVYPVLIEVNNNLAGMFS